MTRGLREQAALLDEPTLLEAVVPAARLEAAALDHAVAEGASVDIATAGSSEGDR
jgi:hypothetical protein